MGREFESEYKKLGKRAAYIRNQKDWSQQDVANILGTESSYISQIERGHAGLSLNGLFRFAKALGVPAYTLLDFRDMQDSEK